MLNYTRYAIESADNKFLYEKKQKGGVKAKVFREIRQLLTIKIPPGHFVNYLREALIIEEFNFQPVEYDELIRLQRWVFIFFCSQ